MDFPISYKMGITVLKMSFKKHSPIETHYRDYKHFDQTKFKNNLNEKLSEGISNYFHWSAEQTCSIRKEFLRANNASYIAKIFRRATMRGS